MQAVSAATMNIMAAIMREEAPEELSLEEAHSLLDACQYCMADALLALLPGYLDPLIRNGPPTVRLRWHAEMLECAGCADEVVESRNCCTSVSAWARCTAT